MKVGVIGVGNMGLSLALRLCDVGHCVWVRDIEPQREAMALGCTVTPAPAALGCTVAPAPAALDCTVAPSPAALARAVDLVIVAVVDAQQTAEVLFGSDGVAGAGSGARCVMLCPTISVSDVERCAERLAQAGIDMLDAPMSGGPERARQGTMSLMVAGAPALVRAWQPLLAQLASRVLRVGTRPGDGARTKLVNNLLAAVNLAGAAEAMALAERLGLDPAATLEVIEASSGQSWIASDRMRRAIAGDAVPRAHMGLLAKDSALALAEARSLALAVPVGEAAAERFAAALRAGLAAADDSALWRLAGATPAPAENAP